MGQVLYIKANPKSTDESFTYKLSEAFVNEYKSRNPNDEIVTLDLYKEGIKFLDHELLGKLFTGGFAEYATQFATSDKYIIAAPMWNLGSPAILKAYFDYVTVSGITFKYTEEGPIGLLRGKNKKAVHIVARGGKYSEGPSAEYDMGDKYIRTILGFMGVDDVTTIPMELTGVLQGDDLQRELDNAINKAKDAAKNF